MTKCTVWVISFLLVFAFIAGCAEAKPPKLESLTFVPADPAKVSGRLASVAEQTFSEGSIIAGTGFADSAPVNYEELGSDGSFSFRLFEKEANRWVWGVRHQLEGCHHLASDLSVNTVTVGFTVSLSRSASNMYAPTVAVIQASSRAAATLKTGSYWGSMNIFVPHYFVSAAVGEFFVFRTYADKALRVQGECVFEGKTARLSLSLKKGWNLVLVRREAASVVSVKTVPGMPTQAKWFTLEAFRW